MAMGGGKDDRRAFLRTFSAAAMGAMLGRRGPPAGPLRIQEPFHGAVLNRRTGEPVEGGLRIKVLGQAPLRDRVVVNGTAAERAGDRFGGEVVLKERETEIAAVSEGGGGRMEHRIRVVWDINSRPRYRISIDDNIFFLRDVAQKKYASLFECPYLKTLRDLHARYGARFVLNIYFTDGEGFDITGFPDDYKAEWKENAGWLRLAFHAHANDPERPYQHAPPSRLIADLDRVAEQIRRFAGGETYSPPTVIHWGMVQPQALKPLRGRGVRVLSGYFRRAGHGWDVNYLLDDERSEYLSRHDALMDFASGIVFSKVDLVIDQTPLQRIVPALDLVAKDPNQSEIIDLLTHEQYFWPFYRNYLRDQPQRVEAAVRWAAEKGYEPVLFHEGFMGVPE